MASAQAGPSGQIRKPPVVQPSSGNSIIINPCQRLNPMLDCIRNVNKEFGDIVPDFQLGRTTCALFLSLKYHRLHPEYIHQRIQKLGQLYTLRLLILMCDVSEHQEPIRELTKICLINNITIIVCWSNEEAGMYLSTYKAFEHKSPDLIKERVDKEYYAMLRAALTSISRVNKTDVETLRTNFGSFANIARATPEELGRLPGFGRVKVRRIVDVFDKPFRNKATSALPAVPAQTQAEMQMHGESGAEAGRDELDVDVGADGVELLGLGTGTRKDDEQSGKKMTEGIPEGSQRTDTSTSTQTSTTNRVHSFGSAADMPVPTPQLRAPSTQGKERERGREPSPVWDIELDLNLPSDEDENQTNEQAQTKTKENQENDEGRKGPESVREDGVDPRLAKKGKSKEAQTSDEEVRGRDNDNGEQNRKSPSPVWDIELDLNDDS